MKHQWKGFLTGVLLTVLCLGLAISATATTGRLSVDVDYNNIKVTMDGKPVKLVDANGSPVEPFAINGTTYLPVRAVANALGLGVGWDQATTTVILTSQNGETQQQPQPSQQPTPTPTPTPAPTPTPTPTPKPSQQPANGFDADRVRDQLAVDYYVDVNDTSGGRVCFLITNNSQYVLDITCDIIFNTPEGEFLSESKPSAVAVAPGQTTVLFADQKEHFGTGSYSIEVKESSRSSIANCLRGELTHTSGSLYNASVTNVTSSITANNVGAFIMFFQDDELVETYFKTFWNAQGHIDPGETVTERVSCDKPFNNYRFYFSGYQYP